MPSRSNASKKAAHLPNLMPRIASHSSEVHHFDANPSENSDPTDCRESSAVRSELAAVLNDLKRQAPRSKNTRLNLTLFRGACCCGQRASEIANLQVADVRTELARPHIRIRNGRRQAEERRALPSGQGPRIAGRIRQPIAASAASAGSGPAATWQPRQGGGQRPRRDRPDQRRSLGSLSHTPGVLARRYPTPIP